MPTAKTVAAANQSIDHGGAFILNDSELGGLIGARGRKMVDSVYLDEVKKAASDPALFVKGIYKSGTVAGIRCTDARKGPWIQAQLRKAVKQLELDPKEFTALDRSESLSKDNPLGFVAYYMKAKPPATK